MVPQWVIEKKRDGAELDDATLREFIDKYTAGVIPDYQMAAFAMAVYFRGMTTDETASLTDAMMRSGDVLDMSDMPLPTADKHSTGGIGDKISLVLAPLAACAGLDVPMISGRGLGITGGTLDKLESIPGFTTRLPVGEFKKVVARVGCAIVGQTDRLAPADKKLYSLRDVTGTVPSLPLITASIMSKKLAEGASTLVFDVKCGRASFCKTREAARELADSLIGTGRRLGRKCAALITGMNQPLGATAGNALEVRESIDILNGGGPLAVRSLTLDLVELMLSQAGVSRTRAELERMLDDGRAAAKFAEMIAAQHGNADVVAHPELLPRAGCVAKIVADRSGYVADVDAESVGRAGLLVHTNRVATDDVIDPSAGVAGILPVGTKVSAGDCLAELHYNEPSDPAQSIALLKSAFSISEAPVQASSLVMEAIR